ncbi:MAG: hypothetical protein CMJ58_28490 [Planctomycetaceae bacterium]|nr:hypothetical protein [Planctomycetaceae bacterium]
MLSLRRGLVIHPVSAAALVKRVKMGSVSKRREHMGQFGNDRIVEKRRQMFEIIADAFVVGQRLVKLT